jgi:hypothetical protein
MEPEEVLEQVAEQEPVVETPAENVHEQVETAPENVQEEPELVEEPVAEPRPAPEPIQVYTKGKWADLELLTEQEMEVGKTYHIKVSGHCQFAVSAEKPTAGIATNEITFTKQDGLKLWIKTGK